jgi:hypothetical protein
MEILGLVRKGSLKHNFQKWAARLILIVPFAAFLLSPSVARADTLLGSAANFAILGASTVTNISATTITGDTGLSPGASITGFGNISLTGTLHQNDGAANTAQSDAAAAYLALISLPADTVYSIPTDLGGLTLTPGVYKFISSAGLTGALTLDASSDPNVRFVFQVGTALTTGSGSAFNVINGCAGLGVFWQVGSSATLGTSTTFAGNILADQSITLNTSASILFGRALALNAAVTMDSNTVSDDGSLGGEFGSGRSDFGSSGFAGGDYIAAPEPGTVPMLCLGLLALALSRRRARGRVS